MRNPRIIHKINKRWLFLEGQRFHRTDVYEFSFDSKINILWNDRRPRVRRYSHSLVFLFFFCFTPYPIRCYVKLCKKIISTRKIFTGSIPGFLKPGKFLVLETRISKKKKTSRNENGSDSVENNKKTPSEISRLGCTYLNDEKSRRAHPRHELPRNSSEFLPYYVVTSGLRNEFAGRRLRRTVESEIRCPSWEVEGNRVFFIFFQTFVSRQNENSTVRENHRNGFRAKTT